MDRSIEEIGALYAAREFAGGVMGRSLEERSSDGLDDAKLCAALLGISNVEIYTFPKLRRDLEALRGAVRAGMSKYAPRTTTPAPH